MSSNDEDKIQIQEILMDNQSLKLERITLRRKVKAFQSRNAQILQNRDKEIAKLTKKFRVKKGQLEDECSALKEKTKGRDQIEYEVISLREENTGMK